MIKKGVIFLLGLILFSSFVYAGELKVTNEHPFLVNSEWIPAKQLVIGDLILTYDGKFARITDIEKIKDNILVYNLEDSYFHNYIVTRDNLIVHNSKSGLPAEFECKACLIGRMRKCVNKGGCGGMDLGQVYNMMFREGFKPELPLSVEDMKMMFPYDRAMAEFAIAIRLFVNKQTMKIHPVPENIPTHSAGRQKLMEITCTPPTDWLGGSITIQSAGTRHRILLKLDSGVNAAPSQAELSRFLELFSKMGKTGEWKDEVVFGRSYKTLELADGNKMLYEP